MLDKNMEKALNTQINEELFSAYIYMSMAAYFDEINLPGCAHWMHAQVQEELLHAHKIYHYISERGGRPTFAAIKEPPAEWTSPLEAFKAALAHEEHITGCINTLVDKAIAASDHATKTFLDWFVAEQVEEEASSNAIVQQLQLVQNAPQGIFMIDRDLAARPLPLSPTVAKE